MMATAVSERGDAGESLSPRHPNISTVSRIYGIVTPVASAAEVDEIVNEPAAPSA
jgi:hypothetical protein